MTFTVKIVIALSAYRGDVEDLQEDIYENLSWSLSKKSLRDMKERAASQYMERT